MIRSGQGLVSFSLCPVYINCNRCSLHKRVYKGLFSSFIQNTPFLHSMSLITSRLHVTKVTLAQHLLNPIRHMSYLKKPYLSLNNSKRTMAIATSLYGNLINNTNDTVNPLIDQVDVTRCCMCHQILGSHGSSMILSRPSSSNKRMCIGCRQ